MVYKKSFLYILDYCCLVTGFQYFFRGFWRSQQINYRTVKKKIKENNVTERWTTQPSGVVEISGATKTPQESRKKIQGFYFSSKTV